MPVQAHANSKMVNGNRRLLHRERGSADAGDWGVPEGRLGWSGGVYECQRAVSAACDDKRWTCTSAGVGP